MIRILHVVTYMGRGGLETMIMNYYRHIDRTKVQFDFLVHRSFRADYDDEIEVLGGRIYRIGRLIPWSWKYKKELDAFFKAHPEYRIIHVHQDCLSAVILEAAKANGVAVRIAHSHNSSQDKNFKYLIKAYYKKKIPVCATQLFACGKEAGDWMFSGQSYKVVPNAIDVSRYEYRQEIAIAQRTKFGIEKNAFVVGHVGRFAEVKNHSFLLDIFEKIVMIRKDARLLLVGDGTLRQQMEEKAEKLGIRNRVVFAGICTDVAEILQAMDVFVFPSLYEGMPVSLVEAQVAGLPCIVSERVSRECMLTELVQMVSLNDGASVWADRILLSTARMRKAYGHEIAEQGFDIVSNAKWLQKYYLEKWSM